MSTPKTSLRSSSRYTLRNNQNSPITTRQGPHYEPPSADLPSLYPIHDGSYGVNTHINLDSVGKRGGKKSQSGPINEDEEDRRFARRIRARNGKRYGMEKDLKKIIEETVKEAEKDDETDENAGRAGMAQAPGEPGTPESPPEFQMRQPPEFRALNDDEEAGFDDDRDAEQQTPRVPTIENYFEDPIINNPLRYKIAQYKSAAPEPLIHNRHHPAIASTPSSFFGMLDGDGDTLRQGSSTKGYSTEKGIYGGATIRSPAGRASSEPAGGTTQHRSKNPISEELTQEERRQVNDLINDMRMPPRDRRRATDLAPEALEAFNKFTPAEIQAARSLIADMGSDPERTRTVVEALDKASQRVGPPQSSAIRLFPDQGNGDNGGAGGIGSHGGDDGDGGNGGNSSDTTGTGTTADPADQTSADTSTGGTSTGNTGTQKKATTGILPGTTTEGALTGNRTVGNRAIGNRAIGNRAIGNRTPGRGRESTDESDSDESESGTRPDTSLSKPPPRSTPRRRRRSQYGWDLGDWDLWLKMAFAFLTFLIGSWVLLTFLNSDILKPRRVTDLDIGVQPSTLDKIRGSLGQIIPSKMNNPMPQLSWGSGRNSKIGMSDDSPSDLVESIKDIIPHIPENVHMDLDKNGKPKISQDFWHALRDLIRGDDLILKLDGFNTNTPEISEKHWRAIRHRLSSDGFHPGSTDGGGGSSLVEDSTNRGDTWDLWRGQNKEKLEKTIDGIAVPRDEFVKLFETEIQSYQKDIRKELQLQDARIRELIDAVNKLEKSATNFKGLTEREVRAISEAAIARVIRHHKLDAMASGAIRSHANDMFANQVNFFGVGSGAVIDPKYTSNPWEIPKNYFKHRSKKWYERDGYKPQPPMAALSPWFEEGECFCAGPSKYGHTQESALISVMTSRSIIPQHLVVEHILPGSTLDPGAMPKDIEVWAYIEEVTLRDELSAFSAGQFPESSPTVSGMRGKATLNEGYVKVGHFTYENRDYGDGIQVFKLSDELTRMQAVTDQIVIRAISNYGADHTCFYRLRVYGEAVEAKRPWEEFGR